MNITRKNKNNRWLKLKKLTDEKLKNDPQMQQILFLRKLFQNHIQNQIQQILPTDNTFSENDIAHAYQILQEQATKIPELKILDSTLQQAMNELTKTLEIIQKYHEIESNLTTYKA